MGGVITDFLVVELGSEERLASRKLEYIFFNKQLNFLPFFLLSFLNLFQFITNYCSSREQCMLKQSCFNHIFFLLSEYL